MSTRALIGLQLDDGKIKYIYSHNDGYPEYVGKVLELCYTNVEKIKQLLAMGNMSVLGRDIGVKINFNDRMTYDETNVATQCRFYTRDRGEDTPVNTAHSFIYFMNCANGAYAEYYYLFKDGKWFVGSNRNSNYIAKDGLTELSSVL